MARYQGYQGYVDARVNGFSLTFFSSLEITKPMKAILILTRTLLLLFFLIVSTTSEARMGGGRSSGFRGSRGFTPRNNGSYFNPGASQNYRTTPNYQRPQSPPPYSQPPVSPRSGFMRNMMGGIAGGFLGSMLFRGLGYGGGGMGMPGMGGGGGIGLFEILVFAALGFFLFRFFAHRRASRDASFTTGNYERPTPIRSNLDSYSNTDSSFTPSYPTQSLNEPREEQDFAATLQRYDTNFDLNQFKEQRMDEFLKIESAWNTRDLTPVQNLIASELKESLESDISDLKRSHHINKLENIAVRGSDLVEAWQEEGKEYATLKFRAQLLDYTINEDTQAVVSGDRTQPVKFQEEWTFVRSLNDRGNYPSPWKLTAIANDMN